jgi:hypothetical protein
MFSSVERQKEQNKPHITSNDGAIKCCQLLFIGVFVTPYLIESCENFKRKYGKESIFAIEFCTVNTAK